MENQKQWSLESHRIHGEWASHNQQTWDPSSTLDHENWHSNGNRPNHWSPQKVLGCPLRRGSNSHPTHASAKLQDLRRQISLRDVNRAPPRGFKCRERKESISAHSLEAVEGHDAQRNCLVEDQHRWAARDAVPNCSAVQMRSDVQLPIKVAITWWCAKNLESYWNTKRWPERWLNRVYHWEASGRNLS